MLDALTAPVGWGQGQDQPQHQQQHQAPVPMALAPNPWLTQLLLIQLLLWTHKFPHLCSPSREALLSSLMKWHCSFSRLVLKFSHPLSHLK